MARYDDSDGSWALAYRQSRGETERREAFELLLRLGIVSPDEFANSLVAPKMIEERVAVAMDLLKQKSLKEWVDLCETAHGKNFKDSVLACFAVQPGESPRESVTQSEEWRDDDPLVPQVNVTRSQPPASVPPVPISSGLQQVPVTRRMQRGVTEDVDQILGVAAPGSSTFTTSSQDHHRTVQRTSPDSQANISDIYSSQSLSGNSPNQPRAPGAKKPVFVIPSPRTDDKVESDNLDSRMLMSRSPRPAQSQGFGSRSERPRPVPGSLGLGGRRT